MASFATVAAVSKVTLSSREEEASVGVRVVHNLTAIQRFKSHFRHLDGIIPPYMCLL